MVNRTLNNKVAKSKTGNGRGETLSVDMVNDLLPIVPSEMSKTTPINSSMKQAIPEPEYEEQPKQKYKEKPVEKQEKVEIVPKEYNETKKILGMKPIYFYGGIGILGLIGAYFLINKFIK